MPRCTLFGKKEFSKVFKVGEVVESGAGPNRKNAAHLKILAIEDEFVRYQSLLSSSKSRMKYSYLKLLLDGYQDLDPKSIQKSVNAVLKKGGFKSDYSTENYAYSFTKAFYERTTTNLFLTEGEVPGTASSGSEDGNYTEGRRVAVLVERIERDPKARLKCIEHYGARCRVCQFDFEERYGSIGRGFIHVHHHRVQLAITRGSHKVDPIRDLIPLCPNCHAMVHSQREMLSVEELMQIVNETAS
jgi:hypothetical protein